MNPKIDVITLGVTDMSRARTFYEDGFGRPVDDDGQRRVTLGLTGSSKLALVPWEALAEDAGVSSESSGFRGFTLSYIVEQAEDVDDLLARLVSAGGKLQKAPRFAFWGYSGHVSDPSGHLWKIASPKRRPLLGRKREGDASRKPVEPQEVAVTIGVADMDGSKGFYRDGLGNPTKKEYSKFVSFDGGDGAPDLAMYRWDALADDGDVPPAGSGFRGFSLSHIAESSQSVAALLDRATLAGGEVVKRVFDSPSGWEGAYFSDRDGFLWKVSART